MFFWKARLRAAGIHLAVSLLVFLSAATLVFWVWYPYPYRELSGGAKLFRLLVMVDLLLGPLLTMAIFNLKKPAHELFRDIAVVVLLQMSALAYGLWTVAVARPVHLVFEIDRFRVIHAIDVPDELLSKASPGMKSLPLFTRGILAVRPFVNNSEGFDATVAALQGVDLATRPDLWQPYADAATRVRQAGKPVTDLKRRFVRQAQLIDEAVIETGRSENTLISLPVVSRQAFWTVLLEEETLAVVGFIPLDPF